MTQFILIPTISEQQRDSELLTAYSIPRDTVSAVDRAMLDKQRSLITFPLQELLLSQAGFNAVDAVRRVIAAQGGDIAWLESLKLYCSGKCEGNSCELGFALALLLQGSNGDVDIVASGALGGAGHLASVDAVVKLQEKLRLVLRERQAGRLIGTKVLFFIPNIYADQQEQAESDESLEIIDQLRAVNVDVLAIDHLADIFSVTELFNSLNHHFKHLINMPKLIIKHISSSKAGQSESLEIKHSEIVFGRAEDCQIQYDSEQDNLVSRNHCKIEWLAPNRYVLTDLGSSNGTFVNGQRINQPTELHVDDSVQLGAGGAEFIFDLDPRPLKVNKTKLADAPAATPRQTKLNDSAPVKHTVYLQHISGAKAQQIEVIELLGNEIVLGRGDDCQVNFDPEQEDLVSRNHCKLTVSDINQYWLTDLLSSNGTFVNGELISQPMLLNAGDIVQLGKGGPSWLFDAEPKPYAEPTRRAHLALDTKNIAKHKEAAVINASALLNRKNSIAFLAVMLVMVGLGLGYLQYQNRFSPQGALQAGDPTSAAAKKLSPAEIFKLHGNSNVLIEASWKLVHTATGKQVFQRYACFVQKGKCVTEKLPWYIQHDGIVEPFLDTDADNGIAIGSSLRGSGFVVHEGGFIMTNRHVAANWHAQSRDFQLPGILVDCNDSACSQPAYKVLDAKTGSAYLASLNQWIPSKTRMFGQKPLFGKIVEGRNDYLDVTFANSSLRIPAHLVRVSDVADVAMLKIDLPRPVPALELNAVTPVSPGDNITVMGYPGISSEMVARTKPQDPIGGGSELRTIPELTVTNGNVGKVMNSSAKTESTSIGEFYSSMGDVYQLTVNATGSGNSGGPIFNDLGQVIGLFTYGRSDQAGVQISFGVPIKYGLELMDVSAFN